MTLHSSQVQSCVTDKHNTKYNTLISEQPYIHAWWLIFTFPGQNEPRPVSRAEVTGRLSLPDATSAHAREMVGNLGPQ